MLSQLFPPEPPVMNRRHENRAEEARTHANAAKRTLAAEHGSDRYQICRALRWEQLHNRFPLVSSESAFRRNVLAASQPGSCMAEPDIHLRPLGTKPFADD